MSYSKRFLEEVAECREVLGEELIAKLRSQFMGVEGSEVDKEIEDELGGMLGSIWRDLIDRTAPDYDAKKLTAIVVATVLFEDYRENDVPIDLEALLAWLKGF